MTAGTQAITVEQLLALNDEIRALTRAGVPLERGLRAVGKELPGRLGRLADLLGERLEQGAGLLDVIDAHGDSFPPVYRAVVAAGMRAGRLPAALESIAHSVRQAAELRRSLIIALTYPVVLAAIATTVLVVTRNQTVPAVQGVFETLGIERPLWYQAITSFSEQLMPALPWIWGAILLGLVYWYFQSRRAARLGRKGRSWLPTIGAVRRAGRLATFADMLAMLIDQQVPLAEAIPLAASAAGGADIIQAGKSIGEALRRGERLSGSPSGIPPLMVWLITTSSQPAALSRALRHNAAAHRRQAMRMCLVLGVYLPIFLSAVVGGIVVLYYVLLTMAPFYYLLYQLGQP